MEKIIKRPGISPPLFVLLCLALVFIAYLLAGGQDRLMPMYAFPEPAYGCNFDNIGVISTIQPPELSRGYRQSELLVCYPPQYFPLYALAIIGLLLCAWALIGIGKKMFQHAPDAKTFFLNAGGTGLLSFLMVLIGGRVFKLELDLIGGGHPEPADIFNVVAFVLITMGLLMMILVIVSSIVRSIRDLRHRLC